jgi:hypothetical protein
LTAALIALLSHACAPHADGHAAAVSVAKAAGHEPGHAHHERHLIACDQVAAEARGCLPALAATQPCGDLATSSDTLPSMQASTWQRTPAVASHRPPTFLLVVSLRI